VQNQDQDKRSRILSGVPIDWESLGITLLLFVPGLIFVTVSLLGLSRIEKCFAAAFCVAFAALQVNLRRIINTGDQINARSLEDFDRWLAQMDHLRSVANTLWWISMAAASGFLVASLLHIWRQRKTIVAKIRFNELRHTRRPESAKGIRSSVRDTRI
jgi:hypothetical protein